LPRDRIISGNEQDPDMICEVFVLAPSDLVPGDEIEPRAQAAS
jgi:hypothetical protein